MPVVESVFFYEGTTLKSGIAISTGIISDLLCEGEIEGIVNYENALAGTLGSIGYDSNTQSTFSFLRSIYFNEEPVVDKEGRYNFQNVNIRVEKGAPNGDVNIETNALRPDIAFTRTINERLRGPTSATADPKVFAKKYRITNKNISSLKVNIKLASLYSTSELNGELIPSTVMVKVLCRPIYVSTISEFITLGGSLQKTITGTLTSTYLRSIILDLAPTIDTLNLKTDKNFLGWEIQVYRSSVEPTTTAERNQSFVDSITEVYDSSLSYPNSAVVYSAFDAEYFSETPDRYYDVRMSKVNVPSNYDPILRKYTGSWAGQFKAAKEWTDNPAWCFYDLLSNARYGLGKYLKSNLIDKWTLYRIAQYCDQLVPDGYGGLEPRFSCNLIIQSREEAFKVINDMASVFRSINYYFGGSVFTIQDSPKDPIYQFTNSNILNGEFLYSNTSRKVRHTVAIIRYNDKANFYKPAVEYVEDVDGIRKYGHRELEVTAFGCTTRGQALRFGRWMLLTETLETESINFKSGPEGSLLRPGDVIEVVDSNRKSSFRSGRTKSIDNSVSSQTLSVVLDRELQGIDPNTSYNLCLSTPTYNYDSIPGAVTSVSQINDIRKEQILKFHFNSTHLSAIPIATGAQGVVYGSKISLSNNYIDTSVYNIIPNAVWGIFTTGDSKVVSTSFDEAVTQEEKYRIININEDEGHNFSVAALEYNESKYKAIELGFSFDTLNARNTTTFSLPSPPQNYTITKNAITRNTYTFTISITPPTVTDNISYYAVYARQSSADTTPFSNTIPSDADALSINIFSQPSPQGTIAPNVGGRWWFRVYSVNPLGGFSSTYPADKYVEISAVFAIEDVGIHSLRISTDPLAVNTSASNDTAALKGFTVAEPVFLWNTSNPYNVSNIRFVAKILTPANKVADITNITEPLLKFNFLANLLITTDSTYTYIDEYLRNYTVYVEAYDQNDHSSKGGTRQTNTFSTPSNGYDLLQVSNPALAIDPFESYGASLAVNGVVSIYNLDKTTDAIGFYVFYSLNSFSYSADIKDQLITFIANKKIFVKKFYSMNDASFSLGSNSDLGLGGFPSVATDTLHLTIAPFDQIDEQKGFIFTTYQNNPGSLGLKTFNPAGWLQATSLIGATTKTLTKSVTDIVRTVGQGFKAWIRIKEDGTWIGRGIAKVQSINSAVVYPNYRGYSPFNCGMVNRNPSRAFTHPDYGWHPSSSKNIVIANITTTISTEDYTVYCGWLSPPTQAAYSADNAAGAATNLFAYRGAAEGKVNSDSTQSNEAIGFKRYRVWLTPEATPIDANYSIIGINASNRSYQPFDQIVAKYGLSTYINQGLNLRFQGKYDDVVAARTALGATNPLYQNEIFSDSPWWKNHPAGFGQGWGGLNKTVNYFDVHMGHLVDFSYLREGFFAMVSQDEVGNTFKATDGVVDTIY